MTGGRSGGSIARSASVYVEGKHDDQDAVDNEPGGRGSGPVARALYDNLTPAVSFLLSTLLMCSARRYCLIPSTFLILVCAPPGPSRMNLSCSSSKETFLRYWSKSTTTGCSVPLVDV